MDFLDLPVVECSATAASRDDVVVDDAQKSDGLSRSFTQGAESPTMPAGGGKGGAPAELQASFCERGAGSGAIDAAHEFVFVPAPRSKAAAAAAAPAAAATTETATGTNITHNIIPPPMPQGRSLTGSMRLAAHSYSLHSPDGAPVTLQRRRAQAARASDGGGASSSSVRFIRISSFDSAADRASNRNSLHDE